MTDQRLDELRRKIRKLVEERRQRRVPPDPPPRYDDVYFVGTAWLDRIARGDEEDWISGRVPVLEGRQEIEGVSAVGPRMLLGPKPP